MKEHESRKLKNGEVCSYENTDFAWKAYDDKKHVIYVDSNNMAHRLDGPAVELGSHTQFYYIHGNLFVRYGDWEIEVNMLLILEEINN